MGNFTKYAFRGVGALVLVWLCYAFFNMDRYFQGAGHIFLYYVFPAVLCFLSLAASFLGETVRINIFIFSCSTVFSLYAAEATLDIISVLKSRTLKEAAAQAGVKIDERTQLEVLQDDEAKGMRVAPFVSAPQIIDLSLAGRIQRPNLLPLGGISNIKTYLQSEDGTYYSYISDEHGFRNPHGIWRRGDIDIMILGDSFTHGYSVADGDDWPSQLRKEYPNTLNLGVGGSGPMIQFAMFKEYISKMKPKVVLWGYTEGNDLNDLRYWEINEPILMGYYNQDRGQNLFSRQKEIDGLEMNLVEASRKATSREVPESQAAKYLGNWVKLFSLRSRLGLHGRAMDWNKNRPEFIIFMDIIKRAHVETVGWGGAFYFVYLTDHSRYSGTNVNPSRLRDDVLAFLHESQISVIDTVPRFDREDTSRLTPFSLPAHWNKEGYRIVAEEVFRGLRHEFPPVEKGGHREKEKSLN